MTRERCLSSLINWLLSSGRSFSSIFLFLNCLFMNVTILQMTSLVELFSSDDDDDFDFVTAMLVDIEQWFVERSKLAMLSLWRITL